MAYQKPNLGDPHRKPALADTGTAGSCPLLGKWTYRSYKKDTLEMWVEGEMEFFDAPLGVLEGKLEVEGEEIALSGIITYGYPFALHYKGIGVSSGARSWKMEYWGFRMPQWPYGVENTQDSLTGTLMRVADNDSGGRAGYVALWMAVKKSQVMAGIQIPTWDEIKDYFTPTDVAHMLAASDPMDPIDLSNCASVLRHAKDIYDQVSKGLMPPRNPWGPDKVNGFYTWWKSNPTCGH